MKRFGEIVLAFIAAVIVIWSMQLPNVHAQSFISTGPIAATVSACPTGVVPAGFAAQCPVGTQAGGYVYYQWNGTAWIAPPAPPAGVASFNGRTGAVTLSKADVLATGLAAAATATAPVTTSNTNAPGVTVTLQ